MVVPVRGGFQADPVLGGARGVHIRHLVGREYDRVTREGEHHLRWATGQMVGHRAQSVRIAARRFHCTIPMHGGSRRHLVDAESFARSFLLGDHVDLRKKCA